MKILFTFFALFLAGIAVAQPKLTLDKTTHNFGKVKEGPDVKCEFKITNTGNQPLIILEVSKPCGCTEPVFPKEPIMPGKSAVITVTYHTQDHPGNFLKTMQIRSNDPIGVHEISIQGEVIILVPAKE